MYIDMAIFYAALFLAFFAGAMVGFAFTGWALRPD
jgi:hypothetical protein